MIFLVRHGEAAASWGEHPDPGLSDLGAAQARAVAEDLKSRGASQVACSPMQRCRETSRPFCELTGLTAEIVPEVSEIITPPDVTDRVVWLRELMAGQWPDDGSMDAWRHEMLARVEAMSDNTVVFSHFVAINTLVGQLMDTRDVLVFRPGYCSVTVLERVGGALRVKELGSEAATRVL